MNRIQYEGMERHGCLSSDIGNDNLQGVEGREESEVKVYDSSIFSY